MSTERARFVTMRVYRVRDRENPWWSQSVLELQDLELWGVIEKIAHSNSVGQSFNSCGNRLLMPNLWT